MVVSAADEIVAQPARQAPPSISTPPLSRLPSSPLAVPAATSGSGSLSSGCYLVTIFFGFLDLTPCLTWVICPLVVGTAAGQYLFALP